MHELFRRLRPACRVAGLIAVALVSLPGLALAGPETPATPSEPPVASEAPKPGDGALARALVVGTGISRSFATQIPQLIDQIGTQLAQARPELAEDLSLVLDALKPELDRRAEEIVEIAAKIYAKHITQEDLQAAVAFFTSGAGRKYVEAQPAVLTEVVTAMQGWQGKLSTDIMARLRAEMKKKGHEL